MSDEPSTADESVDDENDKEVTSSEAESPSTVDPSAGEPVSTDGGNTGVATDAVAQTDDDPSVLDLAQQPIVKTWTTFVASQFALIGVGIGLVMLLLDVVDESMFEFDGMGGMGGTMLGLPPENALFWSVVLAAAIGLYFGATLETDDTTTMLVAAISTGIGTIALLVTSAIFTSVAVDGLSVDFGGLLIISLVTAIGVGVVAAGSVWLVQNRPPESDALDAERA
ncbi:hypothetical protein [Natronosalvus vescus]|uniref:hypothetical protein n=1 Tax=Natronosalvus vescus TaxID=2953881 RepID=UPI0020904323|nr:hypothetical protein [Natronosalvus vescus]